MCEWCGSYFDSEWRSNPYCSAECRGRAYRHLKPPRAPIPRKPPTLSIGDAWAALADAEAAIPPPPFRLPLV